MITPRYLCISPFPIPTKLKDLAPVDRRTMIKLDLNGFVFRPWCSRCADPATYLRSSPKKHTVGHHGWCLSSRQFMYLCDRHASGFIKNYPGILFVEHKADVSPLIIDNTIKETPDEPVIQSPQEGTP